MLLISGTICAIVGNVSFGASYVFYYAYIPTLTRYGPEVIESHNSDATEQEKFLIAEKVGKENEFFGLYEITDKGSSWIGPLVVGAITNSKGAIRQGFIFLTVSKVIPIILTIFVKPERGKKQAKVFDNPHYNTGIKLNSMAEY